MVTLAKSTPLAVLTVFVLLVPAAARAQDPRFLASFAPALATVSGDAELALGGTFGYRVSQHLWFEGDLTWINAAAGGFRSRDIRLDGRGASQFGLADVVRSGSLMFGQGRIPALPVLPSFPGDLSAIRLSTDGSTFIGTMGVRWEFPVETTRVRPYVAGGLGVNKTDQHFNLSATSISPAIDETSSQTGIALSAGAGARIRVSGPISADVSAKYFRLSDDRNIMRLGGGIGIRF